VTWAIGEAAAAAAGSRPSSWWRFEMRLTMRRHGLATLGGKSSAFGAPQGSAIDGMADCAAAEAPLSSPAPSAYRCAATGLDSGPPAKRLASMKFG
jgi:hypothetical protein